MIRAKCFFFFLLSLVCSVGSFAQSVRNRPPEQLRVSKANPHLLETVSGKPIFLNNFTIWKLIEHGDREMIDELLTICKNNRYNMVSSMVLGFVGWEGRQYKAGVSPYGVSGFESGARGVPDPTRIVTTPGNDPSNKEQYDFWDHVEYAIDLTADKGMYIGLHPAWGNWFSGFVHGQKPEDILLFDEKKAYSYGNWLGNRFGKKTNVIWMLGGDRSAVYDNRTKWYAGKDTLDYRHLYRAMAEGLADGTNGVTRQDGQADYRTSMISYHPRKWAPNSSAWFHNDKWLLFNSSQDTPTDHLVSMPADYSLSPTKPAWLYEGVYEGAIHTWGVRYQAYQSAFRGGFGHTYGSDIWEFTPNWREMAALPGNGQMAHLYTAMRGIWTDEQYVNRQPDESLLVGDKGKTVGRGIFAVTDFETKNNKNLEKSDLISVMRATDGAWAMVYTAGGRDVLLNTAHLEKGTMQGYWFNPRNGKWWVNGTEKETMTPFQKKITTGTDTRTFETPGEPGPDNDWLLILKK